MQYFLFLTLTLLYYQISSTKWDTTSESDLLTIFWRKIGMDDAKICKKPQKLFNQLSNSISTFNLKSGNGTTPKIHSGSFVLVFVSSFLYSRRKKASVLIIYRKNARFLQKIGVRSCHCRFYFERVHFLYFKKFQVGLSNLYGPFPSESIMRLRIPATPFVPVIV